MSDHEITEEGLTRRQALKRGAILGGVALAWTTPAVQIVGMSPALAQSTSPGLAGCTPGFWKNSTESWTIENGPLGGPVGLFGDCVPEPTDSLLDALNYGGSGGMAFILLRAAAAALLNAEHPDVSYTPSYTPSHIKSAVSVALCSDNELEMERLKDELDSYNNAGCPLSNDNSFNKPNRPGQDK